MELSYERGDSLTKSKQHLDLGAWAKESNVGGLQVTLQA